MPIKPWQGKTSPASLMNSWNLEAHGSADLTAGAEALAVGMALIENPCPFISWPSRIPEPSQYETDPISERFLPALRSRFTMGSMMVGESSGGRP